MHPLKLSLLTDNLLSCSKDNYQDECATPPNNVKGEAASCVHLVLVHP